MRESEVRERLRNGEDPLKLAIEKWKRIVDGTGEDLKGNNCALCIAYREKDLCCTGCPVSQKVDSFGCDGTPYIEYLETKTADPNNTELIHKLAMEELAFLESLKPKPELNVVEKFKEWFTALTVTEQRDLYDILSLVRGPDNTTIGEKVKMEITGRIRFMLGIDRRPGDTRDSRDRNFGPGVTKTPFPSYNKTMSDVDELEDTHPTVGLHYFKHAKEALKRLKDLGILE